MYPKGTALMMTGVLAIKTVVHNTNGGKNKSIFIKAVYYETSANRIYNVKHSSGSGMLYRAIHSDEYKFVSL